MSKELAASGQLSAEQDYKSVWKPDELERIIDQYVKHYELNDGESTYDPSDEERIVIKDAIMGLLVDREWDNEWGKHIAALSSRRGTFADGIEAAAKLADANGGLQIRWFASEIRALAQGASMSTDTPKIDMPPYVIRLERENSRLREELAEAKRDNGLAKLVIQQKQEQIASAEAALEQAEARALEYKTEHAALLGTSQWQEVEIADLRDDVKRLMQTVSECEERALANEKDAAVAKFGATCFAEHRSEMSDLDGGWLQERALECGLIYGKEVTAEMWDGCGSVHCECEVGDICYFPTEAGKAAIAGAKHEG